MLVYPQLPSGALAQFPIVKRHRQRTVVNTLADSTLIKLADPYGAILEWQLNYVSLSDSEILSLQQFFLATEGSLNVFTFIDPTANLLSWSEQLTNTAWNADPFLSVSSGIADPIGGTSAWTVTNSGAAPQGIIQTLSAPGAYVYCFSTYVRADAPANITLLCGTATIACTLQSNWTRMSVTGSGDPAAQSIVFGIKLQPGTSAEIYGLQAESQPAASVYKTSEIGGVYENASFRDDVFSFTTTDLNHHSTTVNIVHASSL